MAPFWRKMCIRDSSYLVKDVKDMPRIFKEAFYIASTGRQGPVLIDVPIDIQKQEFEYKEPGEVSIRGYKPKVTGHIVQIKKVVEAIQKEMCIRDRMPWVPASTWRKVSDS